MAQRILVIDDERDVLDLVSMTLKKAGFQVSTAETASSALRRVQTSPPSLIILDVMLPEMNGTELCKKLKASPATANIPIIMLSARGDEVDKVLGLELGAEDYVTKPFSPRELLLRVKGLLRRRGAASPSEKLSVGRLVMDRSSHEVTVDGVVLDLTPTEFKLLGLMMERRGRVQTRERLLNEVWDYESSVDTRTVDTHIRRLRDKLRAKGGYIETIRGVGYRIIDPEAKE